MSIQKIKGRHDAPLDIENADAQRNYLYDYYIQINLSRVNGQFMESLKLAEGNGVTCQNVFGKNEKRTQDKAIASVYFKFSHKNHDGDVISNVDQIKIIEEIVIIIKNHIKNRKSSNSSNTAFSGTKLNYMISWSKIFVKIRLFALPVVHSILLSKRTSFKTCQSSRNQILPQTLNKSLANTWKM